LVRLYIIKANGIGLIS